MFKIYISIFFCFLLRFVHSQNQPGEYNYLAEYEFEWQPDSLDINSKIRAENHSLLFNSSQSFFISNNLLALDTLIFGKKASFNDINKLMAMPKPISNARIFNSKSATFKVINDVNGQLFQYDDPVRLKWKLLNEVDSIKGYKVKKATTYFRGRTYIAYYCEEIPVSFGPDKFSGLPGLILKIDDTKKQVSYSIVELKPYHKSLNLNYEDEVKIVHKKVYTKAKMSFNANPIPFMESQGAVFSEETKRIIKQKFKERQKRTNNPIELTDE